MDYRGRPGRPRGRGCRLALDQGTIGYPRRSGFRHRGLPRPTRRGDARTRRRPPRIRRGGSRQGRDQPANSGGRRLAQAIGGGVPPPPARRRRCPRDAARGQRRHLLSLCRLAGPAGPPLRRARAGTPATGRRSGRAAHGPRLSGGAPEKTPPRRRRQRPGLAAAGPHLHDDGQLYRGDPGLRAGHRFRHGRRRHLCRLWRGDRVGRARQHHAAQPGRLPAGHGEEPEGADGPVLPVAGRLAGRQPSGSL